MEVCYCVENVNYISLLIILKKIILARLADPTHALQGNLPLPTITQLSITDQQGQCS